MRVQALEHELHLPVNVIVGALITAAITAVGWIIKVAARESLASFKDSLQEHTAALRNLTKEISDLRIVQADFNARLKALEHRD